MSHDTALVVSNMFFDKTLVSIVQKLISDITQSTTTTVCTYEIYDII